MNGLTEDLADEVMESDVDGAAGGSVPADGPLHREIGRIETRGIRRELTDGGKEVREDRLHRRRRFAVEPVRVALPHPDDPGEAVVAQLDDDGGYRARVRVVVSPRDAERVAERESQHLVGDVQAHPWLTHGSASTRFRIAGQRRSGPNRNGSSVGKPVCSAISAMIRRASASSR